MHKVSVNTQIKTKFDVETPELVVATKSTLGMKVLSYDQKISQSLGRPTILEIKTINLSVRIEDVGRQDQHFADMGQWSSFINKVVIESDENKKTLERIKSSNPSLVSAKFVFSHSKLDCKSFFSSDTSSPVYYQINNGGKPLIDYQKTADDEEIWYASTEVKTPIHWVSGPFNGWTKKQYEFYLFFHHTLGNHRPYLAECFIKNACTQLTTQPLERDKLYFANAFLDKFRQQICNPFTESDKNEMFSCPNGALLYGKPGSGKSKLVSTFFQDCPVIFVPFSIKDFQKPLVGQGEAEIDKLFSTLKESPHLLHVYLFDECDSILCDRTHLSSDNHMTSKVSTFLSLMDGVALKDSQGRSIRRNLLILACTNYKNRIDPAFMRTGRLSVQLPLPPPDLSTRLQILKLSSKLLKWSLGKPHIPTACAATVLCGWTAGEIQTLIQKLKARRRAILGSQSTQAWDILLQDFYECLSEVASHDIRHNHLRFFTADNMFDRANSKEISDECKSKSSKTVWVMNKENPTELICMDKNLSSTSRKSFRLSVSDSDLVASNCSIPVSTLTQLIFSPMLSWPTCVVRYFGSQDYAHYTTTKQNSSQVRSFTDYIAQQVSHLRDEGETGTRLFLIFDLPKICPLQSEVVGQTSDQNTQGSSSQPQQYYPGTSKSTTTTTAENLYKYRRQITPDLQQLLESYIDSSSSVTHTVFVILDSHLNRFFEEMMHESTRARTDPNVKPANTNASNSSSSSSCCVQ